MRYTLATLTVLCSILVSVSGAQTNDLFEAIEKGNVEGIQKLLLARPDLDIRNAKGWTPIIVATEAKRTEIVEFLAMNGANVNLRSTNGSLPLSFAAGAGDTNTLAVLLRFKANINETNANGMPPLFFAVRKKQEQAVRFLVNNGAKLEMPVGEQGDTMLMYIARNGDPLEVKWLIEAGANVNATRPGGHTALIYAAYNGYLEVAQLLLEAGADIEARASEDKRVQSNPEWDKFKYTAVDMARQQGHPDIVNLLLTTRANRKGKRP